ncbi:CotH kinase family protein [Maribellus maritimus]|uniref:CotH kinase family protein n=1 Tax=Maribellus maritimus TaxID=2870838 RepID=UPI001EEC1896|nr:CotH kinase family protein [Maribellus maritimus]MCG6187075.1 CotH kinase family protein [Maribellus maritimus]
MIKKVTFQLIFLNLISVVVYSQNGIVSIEKNYFNVDTNKKIVLINQNIEELNSIYNGAKEKVLSGGISYTLISPVSEFKTSLAYKAVNVYNELFDLYFTRLPVITITTNNTIVDEPRVYAHFSMSESNGNLTENAIGIEYRGGWTQSLPKKSLRIEFWNDTLGYDTKDVCMLGMRSDDDWNLQAMYNEPLRIRSKVSFDLWKKIDALYYADAEPEAVNGVNMEFIELFINKEYRGLYTLSERVDRKQLKLKKFKNNKIRGELYKGISWGASTFTSLPQYSNSNTLWSGFEYIYPEEEINWANIYDFVDFVVNEDSISFYNIYRNKFNLDNAVNYFLFLNLLRATDNTGKNIFIAKYADGEPFFYIPWDLDGTFGIIWNGTQENITNDVLTNGFYKRLLSDNSENGFVKKLQSRWTELRSNIFSLDNLIGAFNTQFCYLTTNGVYERELKAWENCDFFDYNNIEYTYGWLENRLNYLDKVFNNPALITHIAKHKLVNKTEELKIYPNPASWYFHFEAVKDDCFIEKISIFNFLGQSSIIKMPHKNSGKIDISTLNEGIYLIVTDFNDGSREVKKLIIKK